MIDHVLIYVSDLVESKCFYEKAFTPFGISIAFGEEGKFWSFDIGNGALFEIAQYQNKDKLTPCHIAFRAKNQDQVKKFYEASIEAGGKCNGEPGLRPQYTKNYYAAFIIDPSGHNIEAVFDSKA
ncbi:Glyoxalase-like domain protein [Legionella massiliensis]|uniref:Glyoxalase-like domain protein n=1 Tax=Legionella massiliensis TaxID=1034943 RepID=A0A078KYL0_9GAMM|nr:VOC family protein [Legionella massiliensis]CDZ79470.1 Glyoxalase-like domain protein [Legionella massiliensis]CEE15208.1 Glyoxalase-like domain protein [Legionella massiliensis]